MEVHEDNQIQEILKKQGSRKVSDFEANKLELEAKKNWDIFYKRNGTRFFKDRNWTTREFEEILICGCGGEGTSVTLSSGDNKSKILLELGCGVGNFFYPLLKEIPLLNVIACDFSPRAIELVKSNEEYDEKRITAFVCDLTVPNCFESIEDSSQMADFVSLVFVLSAISPDKMNIVVKNISSKTKKGGLLFLRDYGRFDMAQLRFKGGKLIQDNFYVRQDKTRAYYFEPEEIESLFTKDGEWSRVQCEYVNRRTINIKESVDVERTFVQAKFLRC